MARALRSLLSGATSIDLSDNGTALRFITVLSALLKTDITISGSERLMSRPNDEARDAAKQLRQYAWRAQETYEVNTTARTTSQHISALLMAGILLPRGLKIRVEGQVISRPYIDLTITVLRSQGIAVIEHENTYLVANGVIDRQDFSSCPADWSSAVYAYEMLLTDVADELLIKGLRRDSGQPDSAVASIAEQLGIVSEQTAEGVIISKIPSFRSYPQLTLDAALYPDSIPALAVALAVTGRQYHVINAHVLRGKESDRIEGIRHALQQLNIQTQYSNGVLISHNCLPLQPLKQSVTIETCNDHRIALAFAVLPKNMNIEIDNKDCVKKSFPNFFR